MFKYLSFTLLLLCTSASASMITLESLNVDRPFVFSNTLSAYWDIHSQGEDIPEVLELDSFENMQTGRHKLNLLTIELTLPANSLFHLFAGLDAHYGAEIYIGNRNVYRQYQDIWWSNNWNNNDVITLENQALFKGQNMVQIYWAEACCNGSNSIMFSLDDSEPAYLSAASLESAIALVPAPNHLVLMSLGLIGLAFLRGLKKR